MLFVVPVDKFGEDEYLVLLTSKVPRLFSFFSLFHVKILILFSSFKGFIKKTSLKAFETISARGLTIISLEENDSLRWTRKLSKVSISLHSFHTNYNSCFINVSKYYKSDDVLISTRDGFASRFATDDISKTGRTSRGMFSFHALF